MANAVRAEDLRNAMAEALAANLKAYDVADVCEHLLGLDPPKSAYDDPFRSKRLYVRSRLIRKSLPELQAMARKVIDEYGDEALGKVIAQLGMTGVRGELKNLIFASNGPKPKLVLRDAINNVIQIEENAQYCLVFDRPLEAHGLSWRELTAWWAATQGIRGSEREQGVSLYRRLLESMSNEAEALFFKTFIKRYGSKNGFELPALIPQVYLHYDPYARRERLKPGPLPRQRMDFLLLLPNRHRVVVEIDGRQHYADDEGGADTSRYAEMVREDRSLRLAGYEVYRFGGKELEDEASGRKLVNDFSEALLDKYVDLGDWDSNRK